MEWFSHGETGFSKYVVSWCAYLTSVEAEIQAAKKGVHILGSHRFAIKSDSDEGFIRVSIVSPDTETELKNGLLILKSVLEQKSTEFFVWL